MFNQTSGLGQIASNVDNNFNAKVYTQQMLDAIQNPLANLANTIAAYKYFEALYNSDGKSVTFTTPTGQNVTVNISPAVAQHFHDDVTKVLSDYGTIQVPYDAKGDTANLVDSNGNPVSLLTIVSNPTAQYSVHFDMDESDNYDSNGNPNAPKWDSGIEDQFYNNQGCSDNTNFNTGNDQNNQLSVSVHQGACSDTENWTISGTAEQWEAQGALNPVAQSTSQAAADEQTLENDFTNQM